MNIISREELERKLDRIDSYDHSVKKAARKEIQGHFEDARQALAEHEALTRNLQKQTDEKVDLQVLVRELERELELAKRPVQPGWTVPQPHIFPSYPPGVRAWNVVDVADSFNTVPPEPGAGPQGG